MIVISILILMVVTSLETMLLDWGIVNESKHIPEYTDTFSVPNQSQKRSKTIRMKMPEKNGPNETVSVDGITHFDITKNPSAWKRAYDIENDFKSILSMKYMKYIYQRDGHWRTWREIKSPDGVKKIISYKSQSIVPENCTNCETRGTWVIEEGTPPCSYELLSVINNAELCAINYMKLKEKIGPCPSIIKFMDLTATCDNPIVTKWRITRDYSVSGRFKNVICGGREFCDIVTLYKIQPQHVIFRIINGTNIFYSRVMKQNKKNYACVGRCGEMNLKTFKVTPSQSENKVLKKPLKGKRIVKNKVKKIVTFNTKAQKDIELKKELLRVDNFYNPGIITQRPTTTKMHYKKIIERNLRGRKNFPCQDRVGITTKNCAYLTVFW